MYYRKKTNNATPNSVAETARGSDDFPSKTLLKAQDHLAGGGNQYPRGLICIKECIKTALVFVIPWAQSSRGTLFPD